MRKLNYLLVATAAIALVSCGKSVDPDKREPGKWKTVASLETLEFVNAPPAMQAQIENLKKQMGEQLAAQGSREECLTAEAAAKEDVSKGISDTLGSGACTFTKNEVGNGKIDVVGSCQASGQKMDLAMTGTLAPKKVEVEMTMKGQAAGAAPAMNMKMKVVGTHVGSCDT